MTATAAMGGRGRPRERFVLGGNPNRLEKYVKLEIGHMTALRCSQRPADTARASPLPISDHRVYPLYPPEGVAEPETISKTPDVPGKGVECG